MRPAAVCVGARRRTLRLKDHDYSGEGAYYVTVCAAGRACLFGRVEDHSVEWTQAGQVVRECWLAIPGHFPNAALDEFVVMPNHIHGILWIKSEGQALPRLARGLSTKGASPGPARRSIGAIVGSFKSASTRKLNALGHVPRATLWQRNYYEQVIRSEASLNRIREYIVGNPARWAEDPENPDR
jgi:putative transposase